MRVRRLIHAMIKLDNDDRRFIPAGMTGTVVDLTEDGKLLVNWDEAFSLFPDDQGEKPRGESMLLHGCEEEGVNPAAVVWAGTNKKPMPASR